MGCVDPAPSSATNRGSSSRQRVGLRSTGTLQSSSEVSAHGGTSTVCVRAVSAQRRGAMARLNSVHNGAAGSLQHSVVVDGEAIARDTSSQRGSL